MCGRYSIFTDSESLEIISITERALRLGTFSTGEIFPTNTVPVMRAGESRGLEVALMKWGLSGFGKPLINTRSEGVEIKPAFASDFAARRCVIPSTGYYEWSSAPEDALPGGKKRKYLFRLPDCELLCMAGIWRPDNTFSIITAAAGESVRKYHYRMPVVLTPGQVRAYVGSTDAAAAIVNGTHPRPALTATAV